MNKPKVWNAHDENYPDDAVYIGRPSVWGNPFEISRLRSRKNSIEMFETCLSPTLKARAQRELKGKDLVCWCAPKACHGDILLRIANKEIL